jgi:general secretion pathway protein G
MRRSQRAAFTLIELLLVVVIIGILAAIVVPKLTGRSEDAKIGATQATMKSIRTSLGMYETDNGKFPTQEQGLMALIEAPTSAPIPKKYPKDGYLDTKDLPKDGWGNEIVYKNPGEKNTNGYDLVSAGPDEHMGTDDDIVMP